MNNKPSQKVRSFELNQNHPNPFNAQTVIRFSLGESLPVSLEIYDILGKKVATIYSKQKLNAGWHQVKFKADQLPSGIYIYKLETESFKQTRKMLLVL